MQIISEYDASKAFFVYVDITDDAVPFYAGYGSLKRLKKSGRNNKHRGVAKNCGHQRLVILSTDIHQEAIDKEVELIADCQLNVYRHAGDYFACNFTDGGEGTRGKRKPLTLEHRLKLSGRPAHNRGATMCEEQKLKISLSRKGKSLGISHPKSKARRAMIALLSFFTSYQRNDYIYGSCK